MFYFSFHMNCKEKKKLKTSEELRQKDIKNELKNCGKKIKMKTDKVSNNLFYFFIFDGSQLYILLIAH